MIPAQLVRAAGTLARLCGLADRQRELVALEERVTLPDVLDLLDDVASAVDRAIPATPAERRASDTRGDRIAELVARGLHDPEIGAELGITPHQVRRVRRDRGIRGNAKPNAPSGWRARIADARDRGLSPEEMAVELGYTVRTVREYLARLRRPDGGA